MMNNLLSVIIPAFNEELTIEKTAVVISKILSEANISYELIFINDGSTDETWLKICQTSIHNTKIKGISLSRNFGKDSAIFAGLSYANGNACVIIDCDLQHPPEKIVEMYTMWKEGYQVIKGKKRNRGRENRIYKLFTRAFYKLVSLELKMDFNGNSDFIMLDRKAIDVMLTFKEKKPFFRGLCSWIGFKEAYIEFDVCERFSGKTHRNIKSLIRYAITNITSFSNAPMQISTILGITSFVFAIILSAMCFLFENVPELKLSMLVITSFILVGAVLVNMGIIAYYIGKIYEQSLKRPIYIVSDTCGDLQI